MTAPTLPAARERAGGEGELAKPAADGLVVPSHHDPVVRGASTLLGGPVGRHARLGDRRLWTPLRVLLALTILTSTLGWMQKAPCRTHPYVNEYQYTRLCYTDVFALYFAEGLTDGKRPYLDEPVEYPVVIGGLMQAASWTVHHLYPGDPRTVADGRGGERSVDRRPAAFYDVTAILLAGFALVVTATTAVLAGRRRIWDAAMVALAPGLFLHATTNWDLAAVALAGLGLVAWARRQPVRAGVLLGLATATKLYPVLFLVPLLLLCLRAGRLRPWLHTAGTTIGTILVVYLPLYLASPTYAEVGGNSTQVTPSAWSVLTGGGGATGFLRALAPHQSAGDLVGHNAVLRFVELNTTRPADWDSLWYALQRITGHSLDANLAAGAAPRLLNVAVAVCFLFALGAISLLALVARRRPRLPQLLFLSLVAFLLTNKVFSPQYVLWLIPLAVLARPSWRAFLAWQATEAVLLFFRFYFFVGNDKPGQGVPVSWFLASVLLRDAALLVYAGLVVRDILRPERDVVRAGGVDDPAGGILDGAPDRLAPAAMGGALALLRPPRQVYAEPG